MSAAATEPDTADPRTRVFGIRHHGPGSARSLRLALEHYRPDTILIEGPADADPLTAFVDDPGLVPPVAMLAYVHDAPTRAAFWPFAQFSPEWQALRYAAEHDVPVRFCDLPATTVLALDAGPGDSIDPLAELASAAGYDDAERWWDAIVESTTDIDTFDALTEAMGALRDSIARDEPPTGPSPLGARPSAGRDTEPADDSATNSSSAASDPANSEYENHTPRDHSDPTGSNDNRNNPASSRPGERLPVPPAHKIDAHTLRREACMRQTIRKALKDGARRVAIVCGAWHAPALVEPLGPAAPDARLLKGLPKVKARLTWVPWTHSRLSAASGYGAGVASPGWYHHLFTETEQPIARWLTKVAGALRRHDLPVSSAHIIEAVRLAETLAALRDRPLAGLSEVTEATRAVLCDGDESMLQLVGAELVIGEAIGAVPATTPTVPLDADLRAKARTLRLKQQPEPTLMELDLRKERDRLKSRLLHQLRILDVEWGTPTDSEVRATGTFRETWTLRWEPEFAVAVIEASRWGTTVASAAETKLLDTAGREDRTVGDLTDALGLALLADLGGAVGELIGRLESVAALDHDVTHLLAALPELVRTLRYGDVRGTDTAALTHVADGMLIRICAGLPGAVTGLDTDAALQLRALIDAGHTAIHIRDDPAAREAWLATLHRIADRDDIHGAIVGRAVRLLCDAERIDQAESARRLAAALSIGSSAAAKAEWIDGFLGGRGLLLVHDRELLRLIDDWLRTLDDEQFVQTLPLLRRTFGAFESGERRAIGAAVRDGVSATAGAANVRQLDPERGARAMRVVAEILGAAP
ncbi:hypothetical protein IU453_18650 [Nocardia cyriacigeorgica]|uniref:DUF5682 family protein n=1 Tax=Nocardia cyriacigeorgica TaxID=135487 RepID=UPI001893B2D5|nr:DUF5682 family protein [Nocardia cyriacigeorgica]MBF6318782.1 hypothetical protein [Nocardia cyriacigeorgica]MBF6531707.1 hypothetical protein [Nocardia cyriacigeorgica]